MAPQRARGRSNTQMQVHPGWLQVQLPPAPPARDLPAPEPIDLFLPADDPCLSILTGRLQADFPRASDVTFYLGDTGWSGGEHLKALCYESGWLLVARHRLESQGVETDHLLSTGWMTSGLISPVLCQYLTTRSFDRSGSLEAPDGIVAELMEQARQFNTDQARAHHRKRVKAEAPSLSEAPMSLGDFDRRLDAIERQAAAMRKRVARIPFKNAEYLALDAELTRIVQEFHSTLRQRRAARSAQTPISGERRGGPMTDTTKETLAPIVLIRWRLLP